MSKPFTIVVPTDFSDASLAVLDWVKRLVADQQAEVHCINAVHQPMIYMPMMAGAVTAEVPTTDRLQLLSQQSLDSFVAQHMSDLGTQPVAVVRVGRPASEIVEYANDIDADMIVIATRGHSRLAHALLGSTAEGVLREAKCAVLSVRS